MDYLISLSVDVKHHVYFAAATKVTRPRRKFAPIVLMLVFEFVLLLLQSVVL